jgi:hypothetical protein
MEVIIALANTKVGLVRALQRRMVGVKPKDERLIIKQKQAIFGFMQRKQ